MLPKNCCLRFLVLSLCFPTVLYSQQAATPAATAASTVPAAVPNPKTPEEFFARARQLSGLEAAGIPFHLKANFVASGDTEFTGHGTFEEWWQSKDVWRKEATLGGFKWVSTASGAEQTVYASSVYVPLRLRQAVGAVPMSFQFGTIWVNDCQIQHKILNGIDFTVVSQPYMAKGPRHPVGLVESYYFSPEGALQIREIGNLATFYNGFQPFQNLVVPGRINLAFGKDQLVVISIETLEPLKQTEAAISAIPPLSKNLSMSEPHISDPARVRPSRLIHQVAASYPPQAKDLRMQGTVVIGATIDIDGKVREPYILLSAGDRLDDAAMDSVREYRFEPVQVDGKPVPVETKISVNFVLNH